VAVILGAFVQATWSAIGVTRDAFTSDWRDRFLDAPQPAVHRKDAARWWAEGRALSLDQAVAMAELHLRHSIPSAPTRVLTPRQLEVATFVARGLTNRQIAGELVVSERAAAAHI